MQDVHSAVNGEADPSLQLPHPGVVPSEAALGWEWGQGHPPACPGTEWRSSLNTPVPPAAPASAGECESKAG